MSRQKFKLKVLIFSQAIVNLPDKTEQTFTKDGWFKTGDIGYFLHGNLHVTGRISITIKSEGGKKVQPDEIEKAYENEPYIREIGVLQS